MASHLQTGSFAIRGELVEALPRITLFAQLPLPVAGLQVLNGMLRIAGEVRDRFGGSLLDEEGEPLTRERIGALVQRVEVFESSRSGLDPALAH